MISNLERYKKDLAALIAKGEQLSIALSALCFGKRFKEGLQNEYGKEKMDALLKDLPTFKQDYQSWYSESRALIKQLLPDRLSDFIKHYEKGRSRKSIDCESYRIEDCLLGLSATREKQAWEGGGKEVIVDQSAAIPHFDQQMAILRSVGARFESSLFDIRQLVQADLFDSELDAAGELAKRGFLRAAGALAGVVLERHLGQVCDNHNIKVTKKNPTIGDLNDLLKENGVLQIPEWRSIQHLADIRNLCDHDKKSDPTEDQIKDLLAGATKLTKTLF
jgi:hypothetical protein